MNIVEITMKTEDKKIVNLDNVTIVHFERGREKHFDKITVWTGNTNFQIIGLDAENVYDFINSRMNSNLFSRIKKFLFG